MHFTKMQGTGNDFIIVNDLNNYFKGRESETAKVLCDRHFGIGADGILLVRESKVSDIKMDIINSDGSYASMCGNGIRCFAKYIYDKGIVKNNSVIDIETGDGIKKAYISLDNGNVHDVCIYMGKPDYNPLSIPAKSDKEIVNQEISVGGKKYNITSLLLGVPHTVIFGKLDSYDVREGKNIETHELFLKRTNVNFCEVIDKSSIRVKTWERGAGATLACGTGNCSCVASANRLGYVGENVRVIIPGGEISVELKDDGVYMRGPAEYCFECDTTLLD